jgi:hypothetical protein
VSRKNTKLYVLRIAKARAGDGTELFHLLSPALHTLLLDHDGVVQAAALDLLTELIPKMSLPQVSRHLGFCRTRFGLPPFCVSRLKNCLIHRSLTAC